MSYHVETATFDGSRVSTSRERDMWLGVLWQAFIDATYTGGGVESLREKERAHVWIRSGGEDYISACECAGMDADFLRDAYLAGRIDHDLLRASAGSARRYLSGKAQRMAA